MDGKRRAVIIWHPNFEGGAEGIKEAKEFAEQLLEGQRQMIALAEKSGEKPDVIEQVRQHTNQYRVLVRKIPDDVL